MHTNHPKEDPLVELGYEHRDVNYKLLTRAILIFFGFTAFAFGVGLLIYNAIHPVQDRSTQLSNASRKRALPQAPNPLLQNNVTAKTDLMLMRQAEDARLHGTGTNEDGQTVHIPIERAIDLTLERGLPKTGASVPAVTRGNTTDMRRDETPGGEL
jgi:hypothetical protein